MPGMRASGQVIEGSLEVSRRSIGPVSAKCPSATAMDLPSNPRARRKPLVHMGKYRSRSWPPGSTAVGKSTWWYCSPVNSSLSLSGVGMAFASELGHLPNARAIQCGPGSENELDARTWLPQPLRDAFQSHPSRRRRKRGMAQALLTGQYIHDHLELALYRVSLRHACLLCSASIIHACQRRSTLHITYWYRFLGKSPGLYGQ